MYTNYVEHIAERDEDVSCEFADWEDIEVFVMPPSQLAALLGSYDEDAPF